MIRFFKKPNPRQKLYLSNVNSWLQFERVDDDTAVVAITDDSLLKDIQLLMQHNTGGIQEITEADYHEMQLKKKESQPKIWREEFKPARLQSPTDQPFPVLPAAPVEEPTVNPNAPPIPPDQAKAIRPTATKRE